MFHFLLIYIIQLKISFEHWKKIENGFSNTSCIIPSNPLTKTICWNADQILTPISSFSKKKIVDISLGTGHLCQIDTEQSINCFGENNFGQVDVPAIFKSKDHLITTGANHSCFSNSTTIGCWGDNSQGQINVQKAKQKITILKAGPYTTCIFNVVNEQVCIGQINHSIKQFQYSSAMLSNGINTQCILLINELNLRFNLIDCYGLCNNNMCDIPNEYKLGSSMVSTGLDHVCGLSNIKDDSYNSIMCWGGNEQGQTTIPLGFDNQISTVTAGHNQTCVIRINGHVQCVGLKNDIYIPFSILNFVTDLSVGYQHTCIVKNGQLYCFGSNEFNQSEIGIITNDTNIVKASDEFTCEIRIDLKFICWGSNSLGLLDGFIKQANEPVSQISVSSTSICAIFNHLPRCWGHNQYPPDYLEIRISAIEQGLQHMCVIAEDNEDSIEEKVYCQGSNNLNQLEVDTSLMNVLSLSAGQNHTCGQTAEMTQEGVTGVLCWGADQQGQILTPSMVNWVVVDVSAAADHSCALYRRSHTQLLCWGLLDSFGGYFDMNTIFKKVVTGPLHNCVVSIDGQYECRGNNYYNQLIQ